MRKVVPLIAVVAVAAGALVGTGLALTLKNESDAPDGHRVKSRGLGVSIDVPTGWKVSDQTPVDDLNTTELKVYVGRNYFGEPCPKPTDRMNIAVYVRLAANLNRSDFGPRPDHFGPDSSGGLGSGDDSDCGEQGQGFEFTERGRDISIYLVVGPGLRGRERLLAEAYAIAESLHVGTYPWGDFCAVVDQLSEVQVIDAEALRLVDDLGVGPERASIASAYFAAAARCGGLTPPALLEVLYRGRSNVRGSAQAPVPEPGAPERFRRSGALFGLV